MKSKNYEPLNTTWRECLYGPKYGPEGRVITYLDTHITSSNQPVEVLESSIRYLIELLDDYDKEYLKPVLDQLQALQDERDEIESSRQQMEYQLEQEIASLKDQIECLKENIRELEKENASQQQEVIELRNALKVA